MSSKVFFMPAVTEDGPEVLARKAEKVFLALGLEERLEENAFVALKTHFGEKGNKGHIKPAWFSRIVWRLQQRKTRAFFTDSNTLYVGHRSNAVDHIRQAWQHGFTSEGIDTPVVIADGLLGKEGEEVAVNFTRIKAAKIGAAIVQADAMVCFSHFTGHVQSGIGGALKNLGMGCASRAGKLEQHADVHPRVSAKYCKNCGICLDYCPAEAIIQKEGSAVILDDKCIGCGECLVVCKYNAVKFRWGEDSRVMQEKMTEYAAAVKSLFGEKLVLLNFVLSVTKDCDCMAKAQKPIVEDIGLLGSADPVAIDRASVDLVLKKAGYDVFRKGYNINWGMQLDHGEKIGLGSQSYELIALKDE